MTYSGPTDLYIAGAWRPAAAGARFTVTDPATGAAIADVADADVTDARAATDAAEKALPDWARRPPRERAEVLRHVFEAMTAHRAELGELIVRENGKPLADARGEIAYAAEFFRWYSEEAVRAPGSLSLSPGGERRIMTSSRPVGVSLLITPWNLPAAMVTRKVAPALAAGCTVVVKPSFHTPLVALRLAELFAEAGVPAGVVNVVPTTNDIPVVGDLLERGPVRMLSFTGSTRVGSALLAQAAPRVINCSMELGGNAPFIVCRDADLEDAVRGALVAKFRHSAQVCIAANRFFVHEDRVEEFTGRLAEQSAGLRVGDGMDAGTVDQWRGRGGHASPGPRRGRGDPDGQRYGHGPGLLRLQRRPRTRTAHWGSAGNGHGRNQHRRAVRPRGPVRRGQAERHRARGRPSRHGRIPRNQVPGRQLVTLRSRSR